MSLSPGTRLGVYEIVSPLGEGGMGEVYKARDTRLNRAVAIKVLPSGFAADPQRRERFEREAQAIAALNHPNICTLHDVVTDDAALCLVMELLEGETLAARMMRAAGPLPPAEALRTAVQIADALERAHSAGLVHRDIKPANIFLTKSGAKLLDFGLAKAVGTGPVGASVLPTTPAGLTAAGTIVGTFQYMAPEQLEGADAGPRSDIFSFGCVLYEMTSGRKAFDGRTTASVIAAVLKEEPPPLSTLQPSTPPALDHVIGRCLAKDIDERWQSAGDLKRQLQWIASGGSSTQTGAPAAAKPAQAASTREWIPWSVAALATVAAAAALLAGVPRRTAAPAVPPSHLLMSIAPGDALSGLPAVSPDGTRVAFSAISQTTYGSLYVRSLGDTTAQLLQQVRGGAESPAFSPDGSWIAFGGGDSTIKKIPSSGGTVVDLGRSGRGGVLGICWLDAETIVFGVDDDAPIAGLRRVSATTGQMAPLTRVDVNRELTHAFPVAVPGGRHVVFAVVQSQDRSEAQFSIESLDLATGQRRPLLRGGVPLAVLPTGHLLFRRGTDVQAVAFDLERAEIRGQPVTVISNVAWMMPTGTTALAASRTGTIVYLSASEAGTYGLRQVLWLDRDHANVPVPLPPKDYFDPRVSPDGQQLAIEAQDGGDDIWIADLRRGTTTRLTFDPGEDETPAWSPDGRWVAYASSRAGQQRTIYRRASDGSGPEEKLFVAPEHMHVDDWSGDGKRLLLTVDTTAGKTDVWVLPLDGSAKPVPILDTRFAEHDARLSPDGRWIAYESDESGRGDVYVQRFPSLGSKVQVSADGGSQPVWARDGRQLFYRGGGKVMNVTVSATDPIQLGAPVAAYDDTYLDKGANHTGYDVSADGKRLIFSRESNTTPRKQLDVLQGWLPELQRRVPVK